MAVENINAAGLAAIKASPPTTPTAGQSGAIAEKKTVSAAFTPSASQSSTSTVGLFYVPSNAIPRSFKFWAADMASGKYAIGLRDKLGTVIDDNHLGHIDLGEGPYQAYDALYRDSAGGLAGTVAVADMAKPLWQTLGLDKDPGAQWEVYLRNFEDFDGSPTAIYNEFEYAV